MIHKEQSERMSAMKKEELLQLIAETIQESDGMIVPLEDGSPLTLFDEPLVGFASASDALFDQYKQPGVIGPAYMKPEEWLPGAKTVISLFMPFSEQLRKSNYGDIEHTSPEWLRGRIEGQAFITNFTGNLKNKLEKLGVAACVPALDPRFKVIRHDLGTPEAPDRFFESTWSERHAAYASGLGTFGLHKGLITEKGCAGRYCSIIVDLELEAKPRDYTGIFDYCTRCGACIPRCAACAITQEHAKNHALCQDRQEMLKLRYAPRFGCGKCQTSVPCESRNPSRKKA